MKIGAAGKNGHMPQSRPMLSTAAATQGTPRRGSLCRVTQVAFLGHALPHR
jgi:hypothetical protein